MKKRVFSLIIALVLVTCTVLMSSCGPGSVHTASLLSDPEPGALTTKNLNNIYKAESISLLDTVFEDLRLGSVYDAGENKLLVSGYNDEDYQTHWYLTDLSLKNVVEIDTSEREVENATVDSYINYVIPDADSKSIFYIREEYIYYNAEQNIIKNEIMTEDSVVAESVDTLEVAVNDVFIAAPDVDYDYSVKYAENEEKTFIVKIDSDGNKIYEKDITDLLTTEDENGNTYKQYIYNANIAKGNLLFNLGGEKLIFIDIESGELVKQTENVDGKYIELVFTSSAGDIYYTTWGDNGFEVLRLNEQTGKSEPAQINIGTDTMYNYTFSSGEFGYDISLSNNEGFYVYNFGDESLTEICSYLNSDLDMSYGRMSPVVLDDGRLVVGYYDYELRRNELLILTKLDPNAVEEKYIITVASEYLNYDLKRELMRFNRSNDKYKVIMKDYSEYNTEENNWAGAIDAMDKDILSGDVARTPDIILLSSTMDHEKYISKGIFTDLYGFMDEDESFNKEDYLENVFGAFEVGGGLYSITPSVQIQTLVGKKSVFGDQTGWTVNEFLNMHSNLPEGERMLMEPTRAYFGPTLLNVVMNEFIEDSGKCNFNSEQFKAILRYLKDIPADYTAYQEIWENEAMDENYWNERELAYSKGTVKLREEYITSFDYVPHLEAYMGGEFTFIGYPTVDAESNGAIIMPTNELAVVSSSKVKAGCWEVIKHLLSDDYQSTMTGEKDESGYGYSYMFPVKKSMVERKLKNDTKPNVYTYTDENGEEVKEEEPRNVWIGGETIEVRKSTEEDTNRIYELVMGASVCYRSNEEYCDIILQEAAPFFDGQKSVDEVANIINSRLQILVSERK